MGQDGKRRAKRREVKARVLTYIHKTTHGNFRQIVKIVEAVEKVAATRHRPFHRVQPATVQGAGRRQQYRHPPKTVRNLLSQFVREGG